MEDTRRTKPSKSSKQSSYELTEIGTVAQASHGHVDVSLVFYGTPECVNEWAPTLVTSRGASFLLLVCLV